MRGDKAKLLVTGATGFLGRAILARARAWSLEVIPVSRSSVDHCDARALAALLDRTGRAGRGSGCKACLPQHWTI